MALHSYPVSQNYALVFIILMFTVESDTDRHM